jgi:hypothetical protein
VKNIGSIITRDINGRASRKGEPSPYDIIPEKFAEKVKYTKEVWLGGTPSNAVKNGDEYLFIYLFGKSDINVSSYKTKDADRKFIVTIESAD